MSLDTDLDVLMKKHLEHVTACKDSPTLLELMLHSALRDAYEEGFYRSHNAAIAYLEELKVIRSGE